VRGGDCHCADSRRLEVSVGDVFPVGAAARRLPDAAGTRAEVEGLPFRRVTRDGRYASTPMGTDAAPLQRPEQPRIHGIPPHRSAGVFLAPPEVRPAATNAHRSFPKCIRAPILGGHPTTCQAMAPLASARESRYGSTGRGSS